METLLLFCKESCASVSDTYILPTQYVSIDPLPLTFKINFECKAGDLETLTTIFKNSDPLSLWFFLLDNKEELSDTCISPREMRGMLGSCDCKICAARYNAMTCQIVFDQDILCRQIYSIWHIYRQPYLCSLVPYLRTLNSTRNGTWFHPTCNVHSISKQR